MRSPKFEALTPPYGGFQFFVWTWLLRVIKGLSAVRKNPPPLFDPPPGVPDPPPGQLGGGGSIRRPPLRRGLTLSAAKPEGSIRGGGQLGGGTHHYKLVRFKTLAECDSAMHASNFSTEKVNNPDRMQGVRWGGGYVFVYWGGGEGRGTERDTHKGQGLVDWGRGGHTPACPFPPIHLREGAGGGGHAFLPTPQTCIFVKQSWGCTVAQLQPPPPPGGRGIWGRISIVP